MGYFTLEQLRNIKLVISHGNSCPDGVASAMIVADAYGAGRPEIRVIDHGTTEKSNLEAVPGMMFVDFSPPEERAQAFIDAGTIVLDHHKKGSSVQAFVQAGLGVFGDEDKDPGVCGAVLAYEHVWRPLKGSAELLDAEPLIVREFARLSGIRDTWQTGDPDWNKACEMAEALRFWPLEHLLKDGPAFWRSELSLGGHLWAKKLKTVAKITERAYHWTSPVGTRVALFQGVKWSSDVAEAMGAKIDLVVAYDIAHEEGGFKLLCSSRSRGSYDCGSLALAHGGGGHTKAAGFNVPMTLDSPNPYKMLQLVISAYEAARTK
jgi:oligoribonuclease NrnB/cAMP/cGMP phosphodiesterase (DHH superfamily)